MTKQEEIRDIMYGVAAGEIKAMVGLQLLSDLGVVIKVERDLVNTTRETEAVKSKLFDAIDAYVGNKATFHDLMDGIVKAGYEATVPLIGEK